MNACDNILRLSQELGVTRRLLCNWRERLDETSLPLQRSRYGSSKITPRDPIAHVWKMRAAVHDSLAAAIFRNIGSIWPSATGSESLQPSAKYNR